MCLEATEQLHAYVVSAHAQGTVPWNMLVFVGVGWGGVGHVKFVSTCTARGCYAGHVWDGVGWGMLAFVWACIAGGCYAGHGLLERGRNGRFLVAELLHKLVAPSGRPPPESKSDVVGTCWNCSDEARAWIGNSFFWWGQSLEDFGAWQNDEICSGVPQKDAVL